MLGRDSVTLTPSPADKVSFAPHCAPALFSPTLLAQSVQSSVLSKTNNRKTIPDILLLVLVKPEPSLKFKGKIKM